MEEQGQPAVADQGEILYCNRFIGGPADGMEFFAHYAQRGAWGVGHEEQTAAVRSQYLAEGEPEPGPEPPEGACDCQSRYQVVRLTFRGRMTRGEAAAFARQHGLNLAPDHSKPYVVVDVRCLPWFDRVEFWCPGCRARHEVRARDESHVIDESQGPLHDWNRDMSCPTVTPVVLLNAGREDPDAPRCHFLLTGGVIHFQADCTHALAGRSLPLADVNDVPGDE